MPASLPCGTWHLLIPRPGIEPESPAREGRSYSLDRQGIPTADSFVQVESRAAPCLYSTVGCRAGLGDEDSLAVAAVDSLAAGTLRSSSLDPVNAHCVLLLQLECFLLRLRGWWGFTCSLCPSSLSRLPYFLSNVACSLRNPRKTS